MEKNGGCCFGHQEWETLWEHLELPAGRFRSTSGHAQRAQGASGENRVFLVSFLSVVQKLEQKNVVTPVRTWIS